MLQSLTKLEVAQEAATMAHQGRTHDTTNTQSESRARVLHSVGYLELAQGQGTWHIYFIFRVVLTHVIERVHVALRRLRYDAEPTANGVVVLELVFASW